MGNFNAAANGNADLERALEDLSRGLNSVPLTTGNVYYVIPASDSNYVEFYKKYQK